MSFLKKISLIVIFIVSTLNISAQDLTIDKISNSSPFQDSIKEFWLEFKPYVVNSIENTDKKTYNLYQVQITTNVLLRYSFTQKKYDIVDDLLRVYLKALNTLDTTDSYNFTYFYDSSNYPDTVLQLDGFYYIWLDENNNSKPAKENILAVSQFLALISDAIFNISKISISERTETMVQFATEYSPIIDNTYKRWAYGTNVTNPSSGEKFTNVGPFQRRGWGCKYDNKYIPTHLSHMQLIDLLREGKCGNIQSKNYCNSVTDTDLWIIAGISSFVAAHLTDNSLVKNVTNLEFYQNNYLPISNELLISRISTTVISNFEDSLVWGVDFDNGKLDDYPDNKYSGYKDAEIYPSSQDISWSENIGWDISHGRRFVNVFQTLYETKSILGLEFPTSNIMAMFANQYAYKVFNRDFENPLFTNYFDGTNGWYRVGYSNRINFGYGPSDLSIASMTGGYSFWSLYNSDIRKITNSLYCLIHTEDTLKRTFLNQHYEKTRWNNDPLTNLPRREPLHNYRKCLNQQCDSATLFVLMSFYADLGTQSKKISIETAKTENIEVYPIPASNKLFILAEKKITEVFILDTKGNLVFSKKFNNSFISIEIDGFAKGSYFIKVKTENNEIINKKILII
jgi:hypothetical protein